MQRWFLLFQICLLRGVATKCAAHPQLSSDSQEQLPAARYEQHSWVLAGPGRMESSNRILNKPPSMCEARARYDNLK